MNSRNIGNLAEEKSQELDEAQGYACHRQNYSQWHGKDLLATETRDGFDRVCVKPNALTHWTQSKNKNGVSVKVLKDMIQWEADFNVDGFPTAKVYLDVWWWKDPEGKKDKDNIEMERWDLVRMMSELAKREDMHKRGEKQKLIKAKLAKVKPRKPNWVYDPAKVVELPEIKIEDVELSKEEPPKPEEVETFVLGFKPEDKPEEVKAEIVAGVEKLLKPVVKEPEEPEKV